MDQKPNSIDLSSVSFAYGQEKRERKRQNYEKKGNSSLMN